MPTEPHHVPPLEPVVLAATYRHATTARREALAGSMARIGNGLAEHVLLHTCHRVELVAIAEAGWRAPRLADVRVVRGPDAVERALLVAGGLDSAVIAEEQLQGQLRDAYRAALEAGSTGPLLNELFRRALRFGRKARSLAQPGGGDDSLAQRAVVLAHARLPAARRHGSALVIGTGQMGRILAAEIARLGMKVTVASRRLEAAERVCAELGGDARCTAAPLPAALERVAEADLVALATRSPRPVLERRHLAGDNGQLVIDLSAPAVTAPDAAAALGDRLIDLDRLDASARSRLDDGALRVLHDLARRERDGYLDWLATRSRGDAVGLIQRHASEVRGRHLDRLRRGGRFDAEQLAAIDAAARAMLGEVLHDPIVRVRDDPTAAAAARRLFGVDA